MHKNKRRSKIKSPPRVLLCNHRLRHFAGSELVTLDLATEFRRRGWRVTVACFELGDALKALFDQQNVEWLDLERPECSGERSYDLMWGQHFTAFNRCLVDYQLTPNQIIFASLSPFEPLEAPPIYAEKLSLVLANSHETARKLREYGLPEEKIHVFENCVPDEVFNRPLPPARALSSVAIISNHVAPELLELRELLEARQVTVSIYGLAHQIVHVTPEVIAGHDLIITIGRTVQMAMAVGIPAFCYDIFGGPGYLNEANFERAAEYNFSGRCSGAPQAASVLATRIVEGYAEASNNVEALRKMAAERYLLSASVDRVLGMLPEQGGIKANDPLIRLLHRQNQVRLQGGGSAFAQVFYDSGHGFREPDSLRLPVKPGQNALVFELEASMLTGGLRLDPVNDSCVLEAVSINMLHEGRGGVPLAISSTNAERIEDDRHAFSSSDPQYHLQFALPEATGSIRLEVGFILTALGAAARECLLADQMAAKDQALATQQAALAALEEHCTQLNEEARRQSLQMERSRAQQQVLEAEGLKRELTHAETLLRLQTAAASTEKVFNERIQTLLQEKTDWFAHSLTERESLKVSEALAQDRIQSLSAECETVRRGIAERDALLSVVRAQKDEADARYNAEIRALLAEKNEWQKEVSAERETLKIAELVASSKFQGLATEIQSVRQTLAEKEAMLAQLQAVKEENDARHAAEIIELINEKTEFLREFSSERELLKLAAVEAQNRVCTIQGEFDSLHKSLVKKDEQLALVQFRLEDVEAKLSAEIKSLVAGKSNLKREVELLLDALERERDVARESFECLSEENRRLNECLIDSALEKEKLSGLIEEVNSVRDVLIAKLESNKEQGEQKLREIESALLVEKSGHVELLLCIDRALSDISKKLLEGV